MFIAETRTFGFQNVFAHAEKQCWALPQIGPQVRILRTQGLGLRICVPLSNCKHLWICGKKLKSTANPQINNITGIVFAISKKIRFYDSVYRQIWVDVFLKHSTTSPSSSAVEQLFPRGAAILTAK